MTVTYEVGDIVTYNFGGKLRRVQVRERLDGGFGGDILGGVEDGDYVYAANVLIERVQSRQGEIHE